MRTFHRYLGFFLAGIMAVYALSGTVLIFRDTDFLKNEKTITKLIEPYAPKDQLGQLLGIRGFKIIKEEDDRVYFENGEYNMATGNAVWKVKSLPSVLDKMTHLHKAKSADPLFFLNIFFAISLLFFVVSAFWMYAPKTPVFRKGMYFTAGGILLTVLLLLL